MIDTLPLHTKKEELPVELLRFFKKVVERAGLEAGDENAPQFATLKELAKKLQGHTLADLLSQFTELQNTITLNTPTFSATLPLILDSRPGISQLVGSGVLIRISDRTFVLTAAHVTDLEDENSRLLAPGRHDYWMPLTGYFSSMRLPPSGRREDDKLDVAYFCLDPDCAREIHPSIKALSPDQMTLEREPGHRLQYTFAGYPWRKSVVRKQTVETSSWTLTGAETGKGDYERLGLRRAEHIAIRFNRRRVIHLRKREQAVAPLPHGISGGGIYVWSETALAKSAVCLPLAGIANRFIPGQNLLIGTRLYVYLSCIFQEYPELSEHMVKPS